MKKTNFKIRKILAVALSLLVFSSSLNIDKIKSHALTIGEMTINELRFIKSHAAYNVSGGNIIITGEKLKEEAVLFDVGGSPKKIGALSSDSNEYILNFILDDKEANEFSGKIYIDGRAIELGVSELPYITGGSTMNVNQDEKEDLTFFGAKLNLLNDSKYSAKYGKGIFSNNIVTNPVTSQTKYTLKPTAPNQLGFQDINIEYASSTSDPKILVRFNYTKPFRILENLPLAPSRLVPNSAGQGDKIDLISDKFSSADDYAVYFLEMSDGDFAFSDEKKSPSIVLSADKKRLTIQVPKSENFKIGQKKLVVTKLANGEIIARYNVEDIFTLIDADFKPKISKINPSSGSDDGSNVQIIGKNLISPNVPGLSSKTGKFEIASSSVNADGTKATIVYKLDGLSFRDKPIQKLTREVNVTIGKATKFRLEESNEVMLSTMGADDNIYVTTVPIDDADKEPRRDVLVETNTFIESAGDKYNFAQSAIEKNGYTFIESSLEPVIEKLSPEIIQILPNNNIKNQTLVSVSGDKFMVNKFVDKNGTVQVNYPIIQIQSVDELGGDDYDFKIEKGNREHSELGCIFVNGKVLKDQNSEVIVPDLVVLDKNGKEVDGSIGSEIGQRIVFYIPKEVFLKSKGKKNIQIINPKRDSNLKGKAAIKIDALDFMVSSDEPVISSVDPSIVTVGNEEKIKVKGSNFHQGIRVFIDGIEITEIERIIDPQGSSMTLEFSAPKGRLAKTQLILINPLGGTDMRDFYYIKPFGKDPVLESLSPNKGTKDTIVIASGDNFFRPDPATQNSKGLDVFRLLGTRVYLDGRDVNDYNLNAAKEIVFKNYQAPKKEKIFFVEGKNLAISSLAENTYLVDNKTKSILKVIRDEYKNPALQEGHKTKYRFKYENSKINAYDENYNLIAEASISDDKITVPGKLNLDIFMKNKLISVHMNSNKEVYAKLANYWNAIMLRDEESSEFYTLSKELDGKIKLSNGRNASYTIQSQGNDPNTAKLKAFTKEGVSYDVIVKDDEILVNAAKKLKLKLLSPYKVVNGKITGAKVTVRNKNEIQFEVPELLSGTGLKDVELINPDTKSAKLEQSFYYYHLPATEPVISKIVDNKGSVSGGYIVTIYGSDFNEKSKVFINGMEAEKAGKGVNIKGTEIEIKVPAYTKDLNKAYGISKISVPVVVVNSDGASASKSDGFTYIKSPSNPKINKIILSDGSSSGGELVEIIGEDFRYFEPYTNLGGSLRYDEGIDTYSNLNSHLSVEASWDNLLEKRYSAGVDLFEPKPFANSKSYYTYDKYYDSPILPKIYFGEKRAKIVEFAKGYIKVITPANTTGEQKVILMNNDSGVTAPVIYKYTSLDPAINYVNPPRGARIGDEKKLIIGSGFSKNQISSYMNDDDTKIVKVNKEVDIPVKLADITNENSKTGTVSDGRINGNFAVVNLDGNLRLSFDGNKRTLTLAVEEAGRVYSREFKNYDGSEVYLPLGMLKSGDVYYKPALYPYKDEKIYNPNTSYELVRVFVDESKKRVFVTRGFAPKSKLINSGQIEFLSPSYHSVGEVDLSIFNSDGSTASSKFSYTNPASNPKFAGGNPLDLLRAGSSENPSDKDELVMQSSVNGGERVELNIQDYRSGSKLYIANKEIKILEEKQDANTGITRIVFLVPKGANAEIDQKLPFVLLSTDGASAISNDEKALATTGKKMLFIYRKPLSIPSINEVKPQKTSQFGGNKLTVLGSDFREGLSIIIDSDKGVKLAASSVSKAMDRVEFVVPKGLTVGKKSLQIINKDYGLDKKKDAFEVISYPILDNKFKEGKNSERELNTLSTMGGEEFRITGKNFQSGAKVYFGGRLNSENSKAEGVSGFFKDDKNYILSGAVEAKSVEFIDENTLLVKSPKMNREISYEIRVINKDGGLSDSNASVKYSLPRPSSTTSLKAEIVDKRYISLSEYASSGAKSYVIYTYIGSKTEKMLKDSNYRDFNSYASTSREPYKISKLKGLENISNNEAIYFLVRAVNEYGSSTWSNIAKIPYSKIKDFKSLGKKEIDKENEKNIEKASISIIRGDKAEINFPKDKLSGELRVGLGSGNTRNVKDIETLFPLNVIRNNYSPYVLKTPLISYRFSPIMLNTKRFSSLVSSTKDEAMFRVNTKENIETSSAKSRLNRSLRAVSPVLELEFAHISSGRKTPLKTINGAVNIYIHVNEAEIRDKKPPFRLMYYDRDMQRWSTVKHGFSSNVVAAKISKSGFYVLVKTR